MDFIAKLGGGKMFTNQDLIQAYLQVPLEEELNKNLVVNTNKDLFCFTRLLCGLLRGVV